MIYTYLTYYWTVNLNFSGNKILKILQFLKTIKPLFWIYLRVLHRITFWIN